MIRRPWRAGRHIAWVMVAAAVVVACTEEATAPGRCPNFCPGGSTGLNDTIFTDVIQRDSSFRGYVRPYDFGVATMSLASLPGLESRAFIVLSGGIPPTTNQGTSDTTQIPITVDSTILRVTIVQRDTNATNLTLRVYSLPNTSDTSATFATLDPDFNVPPIDSVNVSTLLTVPPIVDTAVADSARRALYGSDTTRTDSLGHTLVVTDSGRILTLFFHFDTLKAPLIPSDSGKLAYGFRVSADSLASIQLAARGSTANGPLMHWFLHHVLHDTTNAKPDSTVFVHLPRAAIFNDFVYNPPPPPLDSDLTVGGAPSARSLLRVKLPAYLRDSIDVVRATAILVAVAPVAGIASDSFQLHSFPIVADFGGKSPPGTTLTATTVIHPGPSSPDTVKIDITDMVRAWTQDTSAVTAFFLAHGAEAGSFTEIRFYSSRALPFRPALHITYVKRFPFGTP